VRVTVAALGLCLVSGRRAVLAQRSTAGASAPACPPAHLPTDTTIDTIFAWVPYQGRGETAAAANFRIDQALAALKFLAVLPVLDASGPRPVQRPNPLPAPDGLDDATVLVWFQVRGDGRLDGLSLERGSGWRALDLAVQRAVLRADSARALKPLPGPLAGKGIDLWLAVGTSRLEQAMNLPVAYYRAVHYRPGVAQERPRLLHLGHQPRFPPAALQAGIGDTMLVAFVVDTTGHVERGSIRFLRATWREYAEEVIKTLRSARFAPARVAGCPVPMRMREPFTFTFQAQP
jgi:TonB family protein